MSSTINQSFINSAPYISMGAMSLIMLAPTIDKDEKYLNQNTLRKITDVALTIEHIVAFSRCATTSPAYVFSISTFALARLSAFVADSVVQKYVKFYKERQISTGISVLDVSRDAIVEFLSQTGLRNAARFWFDSFTSIWFFQSMFTAHKQGNAPNISLPFCALGALASNTLMHKAVEVLDPKRSWVSQEIENDLTYTVNSIFFSLLAAGSLLTLLPNGPTASIPIPAYLC